MELSGILVLIAIFSVILTLITGALYIWYVKPGILVGLLGRVSLRRAKLRVKYVQGKTYKFCYAEKNTAIPGKSSILMVHGFSGSKDNWVSVIQHLPSDTHVVALDLPGHGGTTPVPDENADIDPLAQAHVVHEFIEAMPALKGKIHIVGTSMGGTVSALHASLYPADLCRLSLVCPALSFDSPWQTDFIREVATAGNSNKLVPTCIEETQEMLQAVIYDKKKIPTNKQILIGILQHRSGRNDFYRRLVKALWDQKKDKGHEIPEFLNKIQCPTQFVWGENDELLDVRDAQLLKDCVPTCNRLDVLDKCGHSVYWDAPERLAQLIIEFYCESEKSDGDNNVKIIVENTALLDDCPKA